MLKRPASKIPPGKVHYHCPELPRADEYCGFAVDMWQVGVLMFALLFGHAPFKAEPGPGEDFRSHAAQQLRRKQTWFNTVKEGRLLTAKLVNPDRDSYDEDRYMSISESQLVSVDCANFLDSALRFDPAQRMTIQEALQHRWIHQD